MYFCDHLLVKVSFLRVKVKALLVIGFTNINWKVFRWWYLGVIHSFMLLHKFLCYVA